ncbi:hypothetical protein L596_020220 [Steinernema carpocapsae]|uniref:Uncharacterized protein n=1 Tax=Steinernema carpocapsae TaxID=34508 RepID=A0A4U5MT01_STECR|nr:hypothetical protein L596_020220 [Steinernema carpocapsae]
MSGGVPRPAGGTVATEATTLVVTTLATPASGGLSGGAIAGIVIGCVGFVIILAVVAFFIVRRIRESRKNHGEYRPQWEEFHHAKDLPYLQPPNIEGLI